MWKAINISEIDYREKAFQAPTVALALKWMRDVKELMCGVAVRSTNGGYAMYEGSFRYGIIGLRGSNMCDTYESSESALLDELLALLETK